MKLNDFETLHSLFAIMFISMDFLMTLQNFNPEFLDSELLVLNILVPI